VDCPGEATGNTNSRYITELRAVKAGLLLLCYPKMSQNEIRKAAAEHKEHGVAQKSPINNVANRL